MLENVKKDYFWNTVGVLAQNAISPLLLVAVTRINGIYDSGLFSFAFSVAIIFWVIGMWGGRTYQVSDVKQEFPHRSYVMVRLLLAVVMLAGAIIFVVVNQYDPLKSGVIIALVLFKVIESIADAMHGVMQVNDRLYVVGKSLLYKAVGGFSLFLVIDLVTQNILLGCLGIILANLLVTLFYDVRVAGKLDSITITPNQVSPTIKSAINIIKRTWPISTVIFLSLLALNIPRYFIDLYHEDQVGYFGILAMPITLIGLLMTFILQPKVVHLSKLFDAQNYDKFNGIVGKLVLMAAGIGIVVLIGAYLLGVPLLVLVFGIDFSAYLMPLLVIVAGGIINALVAIFINIFVIIRHFKYQFFILVSTNVALAVLSAIFIKEYGLTGGVSLFTLVTAIQAALLVIAYKATFRQIRKQSSQ